MLGCGSSWGESNELVCSIQIGLREGWKRKSRNHFVPLKMEKMVRNWSGQPGPEWTAFSLSMKGHARIRCLKLYDVDRKKTVS